MAYSRLLTHRCRNCLPPLVSTCRILYLKILSHFSAKAAFPMLKKIRASFLLIVGSSPSVRLAITAIPPPSSDIPTPPNQVESGRTTPEQTIANRCRNNDKTSVSYGKPLSLHNLWMICHSCHDRNSESQSLQGFRLWQKLCSYGILIRRLISWTNLLPKSAKVEYDRFALEQVRLKSAQNFWLST